MISFAKIACWEAAVAIEGKHMTKYLISLITAFVLAASAIPGWAQVAPARHEIAADSGLPAAAAAGDVAGAARLIAGGANVNERDGYRRTPLHVATFAKQRDFNYHCGI